MVNFSFLCIVLVGILFLVVPTYQRGNLNADTIYSSSETFITIDTLEGGNVEVTNIKTDTVAFGNFDTVSLEAQAINLDGSFALLEATNNIDLQSSNGTAGLLAGNDLNINAENIAISSNGGSVNFSSEQGELHFVAGNQFTATSDSFSIKTEVGGALLNSQGGDIDINSSGDLIINSNDKFNIRSTHDILLTTPSDIDVASTEGEITVASLHDVHFNAENSIGFTSNGELISFNAGDFIISNTQSFSANGGNELKIQSFTSSIKFNSFGVTSFASNSDLTVQGDTKGISLFSTGENTGIIQLTSQSRSVLFTAQGHGDTESGLLANVDSFEGTVSGASKLLSKGDGVIRSNGDISITSGSSFSIDTENVNIHTARFDTTSDLNFVLAANNINLYAFDDASSGNTLGHTEINANNVQFIADNDVVIHGGDLSFTAGDGDLALSAGDILVRASRGDNGQHSITVNGTNFQFSGDSARVFGGDVDVFGDSLTVDANDVTYNSLTLAHNFVRHTASDDIVVKLEGDSQHNTQELTFFSFYAGGDSSQSGIVFDSSETIYASTYQEEDITLVSKTYFEVKSLDNVVFSSLDTDIEVVSDFSAYGDNVQVSANDFSATAYSLSFDSLDSDPTTGNQNIEFTAGSKSVFSTPRNENGDDSITASYANVTLTQEELFFTGLYEGNFNTETFNILSNQITLSSDDRENINFNINSLSLTAELNLEYKGDSVTFSAADEAEINVSDDFIIENDDRGSLFDSQGSFSLSVGEDLSVGTPDSIFVQSGDSATFNTAFEFDVESLSVVDIYSTEGPVDLSSEDLFSVNSANNIMFNTGDHEGNLFSTNSENLILNANDVIATGVSSGNLDINVAEDSVLTAENIAYVGAGVVNVDSVTYSLDTAYFDVLGGNIDIISTDGDITFDASNLHISSFEASLAGQEVDRITYEILFSSGDEIVILTDVDGELSSKSDNLVIEALKPEGGEEGEIFVAGSDILITSELTNQFIQFTSGGLINITANTNAVVGSDGDFFVHTANSAQFYAESIAQSMGESITFDAQTNSCVNITHIGNNLEFTVDSAIPRFYNDLEFKATDFVYFQAGDGAINILANGASTKRQNEDGNSNGDLIFNQEISASLRSRAEQGNIIFEAQDDVVSLDAGLNTIIATLQQALFYTLTGQSYSAGTNTKFESESGNVTMRAGHDYSITASGSLFFAATQNTTVLAEDYIYVDATANIAVTSNSGDIFFNTYNNNDININGASSVSFTSGASGSRFIAHGDITTLTSTYELQSARGINLLTNNGPILFSSLGATSLESSEELFVKSGHNAITTSTNSTAFNGNGIVFGSSAADVLIQSAEDVLVSSKTAILQSLGTSQSSRDRVAFNSKDITFQSLTAHVDATELVQIGKTTLPIVTITASGTDAISGVVIDVAASTEIITEGKLVYSSVLGENDISATSVATFNADGAINIDNSNFNIFTLEGSVSLSANNATDIDVDISASFESNHFLKFTSSASQPTQGIEFESNSFELSGHFLNSQVDNLYSVLATDYALSSLEQGGGVIFEAPKGTIEINTKDNALFGASRDLSLTAGADALFSADMLKFATSSRIGSTPITFQAQHTIDITSALTASFTGDYVALSTYGPGADILYTAENLKIASSSGSFISNSTLGSQNFEPDSIEMNIDNFVIFDAASIDFLVNGGKATGISVSSLVGTFNAATQFSLDAETSIDINADGMLSFIAADSLRFDVAAGDVLDLTFTAEDIILTTNNDLNNILIHSLGKVTATGYSINFRAGSEQEREDFRILAGKVTTGANNVQTSFIAQPTGVRVASPVSVSYPTITFNSEYITFNSTSDKEGFGGIYIGSPALDNDITVDADESIVFLSESARILTQVAGSITFDGPQMLMNTNGLDAVIRFDSQTSTTIACDDINLFSKDHTKFMSEADDFTLGAETSFTVVVNGPNDGNGNGIVVTGVQSVAIDTVDDFVATADATRFSALTGITINSPTVSFEGSSVLVKAHGGRENSPASGPFYDAYFGVQKDFVGINIDSPDLNVESPDGQLTMQSAILFHSSTDAFIADVDLNVQYTAGENFEISAAQQTTLTVDDFLLHAKKGITLQLATGIEFEATTIVAQAGNDDPDAKIIFSSNDISFDSVTSINLKSYDTIQYESASNIVTNADTSISFEASRGDILFRSISVTNVHDQETNDFDVEITSIDINLYAGRSIRHIDHWGLGFFNIASQTGRSGAPLNIAGSLVTESNANWAANIACVCGGGRNCECPNAVNRVVQLYTAFLNYGLIKIVTP